MADIKISALPTATTPLTGAELVPVVQGGVTKQTTTSDVLAVPVTSLTASSAVATDASKKLVSVANTGTGDNVLANGPTLVAPALGTPASGNLLNAIGLPIATGVSGLGTGVATALAVNVGTAGSPVVNGGALGTPSSGTLTSATGLPLTTGVTGLLPIANGGTATATPALVAGTNVTITGTWPNQTINSTSGGSGTVTTVSVVTANGLAGTVANATTTPAITLSTSVTGVVKGNGTTLSAATAGTDYVAPGGALGTPSSGTLSSCTVDGTNAVGFRVIPQNSQSAAYTTVLADSGKQIYHPSADTTARVWTIDSNANVAYPIGTAITFINDTSAGTLTIAITADTMILAGAGTTGSRTLTANGIATAVKMTSTRWIISGTNLT